MTDMDATRILREDGNSVMDDEIIILAEDLMTCVVLSEVQEPSPITLDGSPLLGPIKQQEETTLRQTDGSGDVVVKCGTPRNSNLRQTGFDEDAYSSEAYSLKPPPESMPSENEEEMLAAEILVALMKGCTFKDGLYGYSLADKSSQVSSRFAKSSGNNQHQEGVTETFEEIVLDGKNAPASSHSALDRLITNGNTNTPVSPLSLVSSQPGAAAGFAVSSGAGGGLELGTSDSSTSSISTDATRSDANNPNMHDQHPTHREALIRSL